MTLYDCIRRCVSWVVRQSTLPFTFRWTSVSVTSWLTTWPATLWPVNRDLLPAERSRSSVWPPSRLTYLRRSTSTSEFTLLRTRRMLSRSAALRLTIVYQTEKKLKSPSRNSKMFKDDVGSYYQTHLHVSCASHEQSSKVCFPLFEYKHLKRLENGQWVSYERKTKETKRHKDSSKKFGHEGGTGLVFAS